MQPTSLVAIFSLQKVYGGMHGRARNDKKNPSLQIATDACLSEKLGYVPQGAQIRKVPLARSLDRLFESSFLLRFDIALKSKPISVPRTR